MAERATLPGGTRHSQVLALARALASCTWRYSCVVKSTWFDRELPVLEATIELFEAKQNLGMVSVAEIAEHSGIDPNEVFSSLLAMRGEYVELRLVMAGGDPNPQAVVDVSSDARREVGQWPTPELLADRLAEAIRTAADTEQDTERKTKLRALAEAAGVVGRDLLVNVVTAATIGSLGLPR